MEVKDKSLPDLNNPVLWVVEDDISTQRMIAAHLKQHGFRPILFDSAEKAYAALRSQTLPALIILDMLLPGMSGVDLIRLIKKDKAWQQIPVVVVTVLSRNDAPSGAEESNSTYWVNKPFDANNLIQTIQKILASVGSS
ncbi:MAG: response regulator [Elusimicrobiota bacterium]|jgi:DNA-binding response OmpR family regulator